MKYHEEIATNGKTGRCMMEIERTINSKGTYKWKNKYLNISF